MKCARKLLTLYLDNELSASEKTKVEQHLTECLQCQHKLEEMREVSGLLHKISPVPEPDQGLLVSILDKVEKEPLPMEIEARRRQQRAFYWGWAGILLGAGGISFLLNLLSGNSGQHFLLGIWGLLIGFVQQEFPGLTSVVAGLIKSAGDWNLLADLLQTNSYLLMSLAVVGLLGWLLVQEIANDLQAIMGYHK